jgi:hypothetical protein
MSNFKKNEQLYEALVNEIARLSLIICKGVSSEEARGLAMLINYLSAILAGELDLSDFHDEISDQPEKIREYYYKLLYLIP